ncbi:DNA topoisomerase-3 [Prosthecobacter fusiformis]|uniref:DNA topoisomerase n=1 Tax=Prosthecobacter fusiformis TaxID=48464 RepID=A0A4R7RT09_9BACT|nr:DNA topoisomerase III [Prosthecobacter fusiformis]TDU68098.1 DNA topoisomerase-3 [Prosthecobacter fusiformis]
MPKALIIAEKPSVATDLARALGKAPGMTAFTKEKDYFENETHVISSAVGHLIELGMPEVNGKKIGWGWTHLPIMPQEFELKPIEDSADRFKLLSRLMKRKDVDRLINACDAGREGELIFRYIVEAAGIKKPVQRLWMQSMTQGAILGAFQKLRSDEEMRPLADAAKCRSESDWLVGINSTRALTALNSRNGGFRLTPAGRVQTPTLTILAKRELEIQAFVPRTYFEVHGLFEVSAGQYEGRWFDESFKKDETDEHKKAERLWDLEKAQAIVQRCLGKPGKIEQITRPTKQIAPLLYDLTSLQREASNRFGFSARRTLQIAQALYEKFKVLTYPRTDSRYLPEDYVGTVKETLGGFARQDTRKPGALPQDLGTHAATALDSGWVRPFKRVFDTTKVSDHFAIIPTGLIPPKELPEAEQKLFDMVARRFVAVFFPPAEFEVTTRITRIEKDAFKSEGKVLVAPGWLAVYGKKAAEEAAAEGDSKAKLLVLAKDGDTAKTLELQSAEMQTKPPARFNEATLLSTMEGAGKLVEDEELAEAMSERGLGTPATRAAIIEGLISDKYIERVERNIAVTTKGLSLIDQISQIGIEALSSPELTGQWEYKLRQMEQNKLDRSSFMRDIRRLTNEVVEKTKAYHKVAKDRVYPDFDAKCGVCGHRGFEQKEDYLSCKNPDCKVRVYKVIAGHELSEERLRELIEKRFLPPMEGFRSRLGKDFTAGIEIKDDGKTSFVFPGGENDPDAPPPFDFTSAAPIAPCPVCKLKKRDGKIYETTEHYICNVAAKDAKACNARIPKVLCKKEISVANAIKFFTEGKTDLIEGMISKRGRPFSSFLLCKAGEKRLLGWEFPPREAKPKAPAAPKKGRFAKKTASEEPPEE